MRVVFMDGGEQNLSGLRMENSSLLPAQTALGWSIFGEQRLDPLYGV